MNEQLLCVGLDVGTTTTQLIVSRLQVENRASGFTVPQMQITNREILYQSPVHFTPLLGQDKVDGEAIARLVAKEYENAGITRQQVDTGAVIITGETSRKENAKTVLESLSGFAGEFVAATAGPDLESILAAKGAGAVAYSADTGKQVLHMDIGGGTSNLALIEDGKIVKTGCLNVGGRLVRFDEAGKISYLSPVLSGLADLQVGRVAEESQLWAVAELLTQALEMAAGLREPTELLERLTTKEAAGAIPRLTGKTVISFSGGVADCIDKQHEWCAFGDLGPILGQTIARSRLCAGEYRLGEQTIRATVIGAGCHSAQLSGSTVFCRDAALPEKNLPVVVLSAKEQEDPAAIREKIRQMDSDRVMLAIPGYPTPTYAQVAALASVIGQAVGERGVYVCVEQDMAKALGQCLCLRLPPSTPCLCIDRLRLEEGSFLDIGRPVGPCFPVVIKTLILSQ